VPDLAAVCCKGNDGNFEISDPGRLLNDEPTPLLCF
jgi:hypothetical protein